MLASALKAKSLCLTKMYKIKLLTVCVALTNAISLNNDKTADLKPIDIRDQKMTPVEPVSPKAAGFT